MQRTHLKRYRPGGPGSARLEALSLNWLADAPGGVRVARVLHQDESCLELEYFPPLGAQEGAGEAFGRALALTHAAGAPYFGAPPPLWSEHGWIGRAPMPFVRLPAAPTPGGSAAPAASVPPARSSSGAPAASVPPARSSS
ncbi:MAG: hypothetical protein LBE08_07305, partial [Bifidobacteriaceae bacterium]|nr:hypothetical protein [Bifidobacteriaceae bacterium]